MIKKERSLLSKSSNSLNAMIKRSLLNKTQYRKQVLKVLTISLVASAISMITLVGANDNEVSAMKPSDTPDWKIWDLNGEHSVLNIHGKKAEFNCDNSLEGIEPYGSSIFVKEYGISEINFVSNKKSSLDHLQVIDPCAAPFGVENNDDDPALVQLPKGEHQVYVRILGKPVNGETDGTASTAKISSPRIIDLCNFQEGDVDAPDTTDCGQPNDTDAILPLGLVTNNGGVFALAGDGQTLERWEDPEPTKGKGKSKAHDITNLFLWTGVVCDETILDTWDLVDDDILDINDFDFDSSGVIEALDLTNLGIADAAAKITAAENAVPDDGSILSNDNGVIDNIAEFAAFIEIEFGTEFNCTAFYDQWVFNIADLVLYGLEFDNDGAKLVHLRFYPTS